jgi:starch synthase (maltosyl-transferring)
VLAATLGATYGIYGPAFELCDGRAVPGTEEYHDSEKYQVRAWDHEQPGHIRDLLTRLNQIRRANTALHYTRNLRLYQVDNERLFCFGKVLPDGTDGIIVVVNLNPHFTQSGWVWIPVGDFGLQPDDRCMISSVMPGSYGGANPTLSSSTRACVLPTSSVSAAAFATNATSITFYKGELCRAYQ